MPFVLLPSDLGCLAIPGLGRSRQSSLAPPTIGGKMRAPGAPVKHWPSVVSADSTTANHGTVDHSFCGITADPRRGCRTPRRRNDVNSLLMFANEVVRPHADRAALRILPN
jgi:hypothetical protein